MFHSYMQHYEIASLSIYSMMILYLNFVAKGRWKITLRILNTVLILQWIFFGYLYLNIQGDESIYEVFNNLRG
ncbi:MAG: hypothetical protein CMQ71_00310 [Gammaproteobacteria bacterium]|nr:hypothetical protein [Gammaproteobacteria bacterium]